jgi:protein TonB
MFEDSLVESGGRIKTRRGWTTILSFILQGAIIAVVVLIPLLVTQALPKQALQTMLVAPPPPPPPPPPAASAQPATPKPVQSEIQQNELRMPLKIPQKIAMIKETQAPASAPSAGVVGGVPGGVAGGQVGGVVGGVLGSVPTAVPKLVTPQRVRVSQGVSQGLLQHKVVPQYPPLARQAHVQGAVVLQAVIGKDGHIKNVQVVSGPPMLTSAAVQAVKQWEYKSYMLDGQPTEVETQITVNFALNS